MRSFLMACVMSLGIMTATVDVASAAFIDTTGSWDVNTGVGPFGRPSYSTLGQTFTTPADNQLDDFTFYIIRSPFSGNDPFNFVAIVMQWNGTNVTGPVLFESGLQTFTATDLKFYPITINTGGLTLTAGQQYVAFFTVANTPGQPGLYASSPTNNSTYWGYTGRDSYTGGGLVYSNSGSSFPNSGWSIHPFSNDLAFQMNFSSTSPPTNVVPAPPGLLMVLTGLPVLGLIRRFRRTAAGA